MMVYQSKNASNITFLSGDPSRTSWLLMMMATSTWRIVVYICNYIGNIAFLHL
jgi:hypothetical protein